MRPALPKRFLYVLTLWQERPEIDDQPAVWRYSLEDPYSGERRGFGSLDGVTAFLRDRVGGGAEGNGGDRENLVKSQLDQVQRTTQQTRRNER